VLAGDPGPMGEDEVAILATKTDLNDRTRLSCQIRIIDDMHVKVINQASVKGIDPGNRPED
jgi:ferredoxin